MEPNVTKICNKCNVEKSIDDFAFRNDQQKYRTECKVCQRDIKRSYYKLNKTKCDEINKKNYTKNRDKVLQQRAVYRIINHEEIKEKSRVYRKENDKEVKARKRKYNIDNKRKNQISRRLRKYNLTDEQFSEMLASQNYCCANAGCSSPDAGRYGVFTVDHDHKCCDGPFSCGECIRGLLCSNCNIALGNLQDDLERIQGLFNYLAMRGKKH